MIKLRPYQSEYFKEMLKTPKKRQPLFHLATGGGKSVIFKDLAEKAVRQGKKVLFIVAGTSILDQAVAKHFSGDVSVMQGDKKFRKSETLCCSMDTLARRKSLHKDLIEHYDFFIIDEAHLCTAKRFTDFMDKIPKDNWVVGFSATPYRVGKKGHTFWTHVIKKITVKELVDQKYLMKPKIFAAPVMNTNAKKLAGDFNNSQLFSVNDSLKVYGDILKEYEKHAKGLRAVCFCINVTHSEMMAEQFTNAGYEAAHVDADTPLNERAYLIARLEDDEDPLLILCNVNVLSTGVDIPKLECGLMARPTHSLVLWIQQVGRVLRTHPDISKCIILDFGENTRRLAHPLDDIEAQLTNVEKGAGSASDAPLTNPYWTCPECFYLVPKAEMKCSECDYTPTVEMKKAIQVDLVELGKKSKVDLSVIRKESYRKWRNNYVDYSGFIPGTAMDGVIADFERIYKESLDKKKKPNSIFYTMGEKYTMLQLEVFFKRIPDWFKNG